MLAPGLLNDSGSYVHRAVAKALQNDSYRYDVRGAAAEALGNSAASQPLPSDRDSHVHRTAAEALGNSAASQPLPSVAITAAAEVLGKSAASQPLPNEAITAFLRRS